MSWVVKEAIGQLKKRDLRGAFDLFTWAVRERFFEFWYGIDTAKFVRAEELGTDPSLSERYEPTSYLALRNVFRRIRPESSKDAEVFLDAGCGMGRIVLVAARYPYAAVIGIEISEQLLAAARRNLAKQLPRLKCKDVRFERVDAGAYDMPDEVTTIFFYNPFWGETMERFIESLRVSLSRRNRAVAIAFVNPWKFDSAKYPWIRKTEEIVCFYPGMKNGMKVALYRAQLAGA